MSSGEKRSNRSLLWRPPVDREVRDELEHHLELRTRELVARGLTPDEARRRALERFGDPERHAAACRREADRRARGWRWEAGLEELAFDLRFAVRQLRRRPGPAALVVALLALGIGVAVAAAGLVEQVFWRPLPFPEPERLVTLWEQQTSRATGLNVVGPANFVAFREARSLVATAGFVTVPANLDGGDRPPVRARLRRVTGDYFEVLGLPPLLGRTLSAADAESGRGTVVLSETLWADRFGSRPDVVGERIRVDGREREVVGVMPHRAALDMGPARAPWGDAADLWEVVPVTPEWATARGRWLMVVARLAPDADLDSAAAEIATIMAGRRHALPDLNTGWVAHVRPAAEVLREPVRLPVLALAGAALLVLAIVCLVASGLLLTRSLARGDELRVRRALGAGRRRLSRQLLTEAAVTASLAATLGLGLAVLLRRLAAATLPTHLARSAAAPAPEAWLAAAAVASLFVLLCSWLPGLPVLRGAGRPTAARGLVGARGRHRIRTGLVFAQVSLTLVLLAGAGLLLRTVDQLLAVDPGFAVDGVISFGLALPPGSDDAGVLGFFDDLIERLEGLPGVVEAGAISHLPMSGAGAATSFAPTDRPRPAPGDWPAADIRTVRGDALPALGIGLVEGRWLDSSDGAGRAEGSVLVSRMLAERFWPDGGAVGSGLEIAWGDPDRPRRIVGVVEDVRHVDPMTPPRAAVYFPLAQETERSMDLVVRSARDLESLAPELRAAVAALDPALPVFDLRTIREVLRSTLADRHFLSRVISGFAGLSLLLAVVGIAGVTAVSVAESRREIGLRLALGARPRGVVWLFVRRLGGWTAAAVGAGLGAAVVAGGALEGLLYGVEAADPAVLVATALVVGTATLLAALVPARRAARVDPAASLRPD